LFYSFSIGATLKCNEYDRIEAKGYGNTRKSADDDADIEIARKISSAVKAVSKDSSYVGTEGGAIQRDIGIATQVSKVEAILKNKHDVHPLREPYKDGDVWVSERYICRSDAAKPYLDSLRYLVGVLRESSCERANEVYKNIAGLESIIAPLGKMNAAIQKEYEAEYAKASNECGPAGKGIYLEIKENILGSQTDIIKLKLEELLSQNNCRVESKAKSNSFTLKVQARDCNYKHDGTFDHCGSCATIDLADGKNKKGGLKANVTARAAYVSKETACEKAAEEAAPEIWAKIKDKINEVCN
jgi:hypothetical protein